MTTEINKDLLLNWKSDRFKKELSDLTPSSVFFEDDDPRIILTENDLGEACWVIGYAPSVKLVCVHDNGITSVGGAVIVINVRDNSVNYVPPSRIVNSGISL